MGQNGHQHTTTAGDGTTIAWSIEGAGEPVVLVHGITESSGSYSPIVERLVGTNQVITLDLRGHGGSGPAGDYSLAAMATDVVAVIAAAGVRPPHLVGHSLGGAVVTATGAVTDVASVVDIDQSLRLGAFKDQLVAAEAMLRDPQQYHLVIDAMFEAMSGDLLATSERERVDGLRRADHDVVLGVWELLLTESVDAIESTIDAVLSGYHDAQVPYLALFGIDPGDGYEAWLHQRIPGSVVELWADHGHYPHLVEPDRFVERLHRFWV